MLSLFSASSSTLIPRSKEYPYDTITIATMKSNITTVNANIDFDLSSFPVPMFHDGSPEFLRFNNLLGNAAIGQIIKENGDV